MKYTPQKLLTSKYSHNEEYYYQKTMNDFVTQTRSQQVIEFYFILNYRDTQEYLRRFYYSSILCPFKKDELTKKLALFTEYYKYHNEIPRFFMNKLCEIMSNYHDKKRRVEYYRIKRMIEEENKKNPNKPQKAIVGDVPKEDNQQQDKQVYSNVLSKIDENSTTLDTLNKQLSKQKGMQGELILQPSARDQEELQQFIQFVLDQQRGKSQLTSPKNSTTKLPMGVSNSTIKQILSRTQKNQQTFHLSPKQTTETQNITQGAKTHRIIKESLNKMLVNSPIHTIHSPKGRTNFTISTLKSPQQKQKQQSLSLSKQFKLTDAIKFPISLHQHTRSEFRIYKK